MLFGRLQNSTCLLYTSFLHTPCRACGGERLNPLSRGAAVRDVRLPQLSALSLDELRRWLEKLEQELSSAHQKLVELSLIHICWMSMA